MVFWNLLLFIFNLIPLFPIDGWHIVLSLLPGRWLNNMQVPVVIQRSCASALRVFDAPGIQMARLADGQLLRLHGAHFPIVLAIWRLQSIWLLHWAADERLLQLLLF